MPLTKSRLSRRADHIGESGQTMDNTPSLRVSLSVPLNYIGFSHIANTINVQIRIPHTHLVATAWASGGGDGDTIGGDWPHGGGVNLIAGRGTRNEIYGNAMYGSGYGNYTRLDDGTYQYSPAYTIGVYNSSPENGQYDRNFPHGWPPIPWGAYQGALALADLQPEDVPGSIPDKLSGNSTYPTNTHYRRLMDYWLKQFEAKQGNQTYIVLAEPATIDLLQLVLQSPIDQGGCAIEQSTPQWTQIWQPLMYNDTENAQDPDLNSPFAAAYANLTAEQFIDDSKFYMWNVLQYYRGSSVALVSRSYDNKQSHHGVSNATYWGQSKMNTTGVDMTFLKCLNETIAVSLPIVDPTLKIITDPSPGVTAGIVIGSICGVILLVCLACLLIRYRPKRAAIKRELPVRPKEIKGIGIGEMPDDDSAATSYLMTPRHTHITQ